MERFSAVLEVKKGVTAIIGSGGYMPEDVQMVLDIMAGGRYDLSSIITHEFPHDRLAEAIETAARPEEALNVVINYGVTG